MTTNLTIRGVDEELALKLKKRAAANNRSVSAELREILKTTLGGTKRRSVIDVLRNMPNVGEDSDFNSRS